ncbi:efflux RND transporter periplasmic adaptor subunit [Acetobacter conturbans]|uniref:Efflux RND transporter periplasmic adaptor subunit n=1 Tax=Acetobacter conturbans TaxID=1737472 RepID=A0ABX0JZY9_9PROT|nr:efflux RND transporter periplasmic adaptor subunit [Acetobacter conturbans]NHN88575.1 efflux RND transporter periplasmic adaptor subunit [Acetobacter conturbans]
MSAQSSRGRFLLVVVIIVAIVLAAWGIIQRNAHYERLAKETTAAATPEVQLISPQPGPSHRTLDLPANISAWYLAPIYAQVSGYVKMWYKDIGAHVKAGDLLAEIETPGLDAQYAAAKANLDVAVARYKLAQITARRWKALEGTQAVSQQEVDVQAANAEAEQAQVEAARHEMERYQALEGFKRIVAPFDGVVTARLADVGDYVNAGRGDVGSRGNATELFSVADVHAMRVFVSVPQDYADIISPALTTTLTVPQFPGRTFKARYVATAAAFSPNTRTVNTELMVDNPTEELWPDSYATAHFEAPGDPDMLTLPEGALIFRADGMQIATVDPTDHVHLVSIKVGTNLGKIVQVLGGLSATDKVINNPSAGLLDGDKVRVVPGTRGYNMPSQPTTPASSASPRPGNDVRAMPEDNTPTSEAGARE